MFKEGIDLAKLRSLVSKPERVLRYWPEVIDCPSDQAKAGVKLQFFESEELLNSALMISSGICAPSLGL